MTPQEAADLAARTIDAIDACDGPVCPRGGRHDDDRERVASDLAGIERHPRSDDGTVCLGCFEVGRDIVPVLRDWPCIEATSYAASLVRTADLYGVTP